jgi:hypothetical protein
VRHVVCRVIHSLPVCQAAKPHAQVHLQFLHKHMLCCLNTTCVFPGCQGKTHHHGRHIRRCMACHSNQSLVDQYNMSCKWLKLYPHCAALPGPTWGLLTRLAAQRCTTPAWEELRHTWQL